MAAEATIEGDPNHTSTKVRLAALRALQEMGRPLTAHELEEWLSTHDCDLWKEVSGKCYDYIRMILTLTRNNAIVKYRSNVSVPGIDKRLAYFGIPEAGYDESWTQVTGLKRRGRTKGKRASTTRPASPPAERESRRSSDEGAESQSTETSEGDFESPEFIEDVSDETALESWKALSDRHNLQSPMWGHLLCALMDAKDYTTDGRPPQNMLHSVYRKYPLLQDEEVLNHAAVILCREVKIIRETMSYSAIL
jgi:hypothetical protein